MAGEINAARSWDGTIYPDASSADESAFTNILLSLNFVSSCMPITTLLRALDHQLLVVCYQASKPPTSEPTYEGDNTL